MARASKSNVTSTDTPEKASLPIEKLLFDPQNPRLPSTLHHASEEEVLRYMLDDASLPELMNSIAEQGYSEAEPMLVFPSESRKGFYEVGEGNRRLAALKLLNNPSAAPTKKNSVSLIAGGMQRRIEEVPVLIYQNREAIVFYLGYRHITGVKQWDSLAKARYMAQLYAAVTGLSDEEKFKSIARLIGSRADYVAKTLTGLKIYEKIVENDFFDIRGLEEKFIDFSVLTTALSYQGIYKHIGLKSDKDFSLENLSPESLGELTSWLFQDVNYDSGKKRLTVLEESRNLGKLNSVLKSGDKALAMLREGKTLTEAVVYTDEPLEVLRIFLTNARENLGSAATQIKFVVDLQQSDAETASLILVEAKDLKNVIEGRLRRSEDEDGA